MTADAAAPGNGWPSLLPPAIEEAIDGWFHYWGIGVGRHDLSARILGATENAEAE